MIEFANGLDRLLQLLIVAQPAANLGDALATHAELPRASTSIGDRQNKHPVPFATRAFRAVFGMSDGALQQRATQQFAGDRQLADKLLARSKGSISNPFTRMNQTAVAPVNFKSVRPCSFPCPERFSRNHRALHF